MKTTHTSASLLSIISMIVLSLSSASAQNSSAESNPAKQNVIAISQNGTAFKAPAKLHVGVHALEADYPKFLIGLKNEGEGYTKISLKNRQGKIIHRPVFCFKKALVVTFDLRQVEEGDYTVEVTNKDDHYYYQLHVGSKVIQSVDIKPSLVARSK